MHEFYSAGNTRFDWPVSTVKPQPTRVELLRALDDFENVALSSQDEGFLRLAKEIFTGPALESRSRADDWDDGLYS